MEDTELIYDSESADSSIAPLSLISSSVGSISGMTVTNVTSSSLQWSCTWKTSATASNYYVKVSFRIYVYGKTSNDYLYTELVWGGSDGQIPQDSTSIPLSGTVSGLSLTSGQQYGVMIYGITKKPGDSYWSAVAGGSLGGSTSYNYDATFTYQTNVAPNTPTVSVSSITTTSASVSYGTSSFQTPSTGTVYLYGGTSSSPTTQIASKTSTGTSSYSWTSRTNNTKYYVRARAYNGQLYSSYSSDSSFVTLPAALSSKSGSATSPTTATVSYATASGGTAYTKNIQYSLNNSSWTTGATVSSGSATSGSFTVSGLTPGKSNTIYLRVNTTAGTTSSGSIAIVMPSDTKLYAPVNGVAKKVQKVYCPINGTSKKVAKIYGAVDGKAKLLYQDI